MSWEREIFAILCGWGFLTLLGKLSQINTSLQDIRRAMERKD
jgi:hypothetical protein